MDVQWSTRPRVGSESLRDVTCLLLESATWFVLVTALVLWARRLAGAFEEPFTPMVLAVVGIVLCGLALGLRLPLFFASADTRPTSFTLRYVSSLALLLLVTLVIQPNVQPWWSWLLFCSAVIGCEVIILQCLAGQLQRAPAPLLSARVAAQDGTSEPELIPQGVTQRFVRSSDAEMGETIHGQIRATFDVGQRVGHVHLSFCPPFSDSPQIEVEPVSGPDADVSPALVVPHGARLDVRLEQTPLSAAEIVLDVFVSEKRTAQA